MRPGRILWLRGRQGHSEGAGYGTDKDSQSRLGTGCGTR